MDDCGGVYSHSPKALKAAQTEKKKNAAMVNIKKKYGFKQKSADKDRVDHNDEPLAEPSVSNIKSRRARLNQH